MTTAFCSKSSIEQTNVTEKLIWKMRRQTEASQKSPKDRTERWGGGEPSSSPWDLLFKETLTRIRVTALLKTTWHQRPYWDKNQKVLLQLAGPCSRAPNPGSRWGQKSIQPSSSHTEHPDMGWQTCTGRGTFSNLYIGTLRPVAILTNSLISCSIIPSPILRLYIFKPVTI